MAWPGVGTLGGFGILLFFTLSEVCFLLLGFAGRFDCFFLNRVSFVSLGPVPSYFLKISISRHGSCRQPVVQYAKRVVTVWPSG